MDAASSERLALLRFPLALGVVFAHTYLQDICPADSGLCGPGSAPLLASNLISDGIAKLAVPYFFLMSGYLLFLDYPLTWGAYAGKLRSRARSLLLPMLIWNAMALAHLASAQALPMTRAYISEGARSVLDFSLMEYLDALLGLTHPPIAYQFWFVRDLLLMVLLSPLVWLAVKAAPRLVLSVAFALWFLDAWPADIPSVRAVAFFTAGAWLARSGRSLFALDRCGPAACLVYPPLLLADALTKSTAFGPWLHNAGILAGLVAALFLSGRIGAFAPLRRALLWASGFGFFIFCGHEPLLTDLRKVVGPLLPADSQWMLLAQYFLLPVLAISMMVLAHISLQRYAPALLALVSGGRSKRKSGGAAQPGNDIVTPASTAWPKLSP